MAEYLPMCLSLGLSLGLSPSIKEKKITIQQNDIDYTPSESYAEKQIKFANATWHSGMCL